METFSELLIAAGTMIKMRRDGKTEMEVAEWVNKNYRLQVDGFNEEQNLESFRHKMHLGKYKGKYLDEVDDLMYLKWFYENVRLSPQFKLAVHDKINSLSTLMK
jgi:uncharacterized protein (DUF3820 family)